MAGAEVGSIPEAADASSPRGDDAGGKRADIQALRALAVALVLLFHLWPTRVPGGFVGVDVFFVVSGFLITGVLMRELSRDGRISLARFWARRARRLLPASLLVLAVTLLLTVTFLPQTQWAVTAPQVMASALYVENWFLARQAVDYWATEGGASPVQHYWSLSVEEQFYIVVPVLIVIIAAVMRRRPSGGVRALIIVVTALSFALTVLYPARASAAFYFVTPTRAWEFGVGALLAFAPASQGWRRTRGLVAWAAVAGIVGVAFMLDGDTVFPGWATLLPVLGAGAVIAARADGGWSPMIVGRARLVQGAGDISYSIYLWHWPLIVVAPWVLNRQLQWFDRVGIVMATVMVAVACYRYVEQPVRTQGFLIRRPSSVSLVVALASSSVVVAAGGAVVVGVENTKARDRAVEASIATVVGDAHGCYGAAAIANGPDCADPVLDGVVAPSALTAVDMAAKVCWGENESGLVPCEWGTDAAHATETVALVGDSHASHWRPALVAVAEQRGWRILELTRASCPFNLASRSGPGIAAATCDAWNREVSRFLGAEPGLSRVFTAGFSQQEYLADGAAASYTAGVDGYVDAWAGLPSTVHVVALRDVPRPLHDVVDCVDALPDVATMLESNSCSLPEDVALLEDPIVMAVVEAPGRATLLDLTEYFCQEGMCDPVIGHAMVYRDAHHITTGYARSLAPYLAAGLEVGADRQLVTAAAG
ncbi:acyltransferase family protein [Demequina iriomotensis]|uniref:acyltransferase family protein n=1 Tax=Demequina iriomotensis TaxID=1536641 RepID=UPI000784C5E3|nr:acyltransferase family protein [Demequina iriomotensis]